MRWDQSIPQRAEDRWEDMRKSVQEQRLLKQVAGSPSAARQHPRGLVRIFAWLLELGKVASRVTNVRSALLLLGLLALAAGRPEVSTASPTIPEMARHLAENVLGEGTVRSVQLQATGLRITWESATYRPRHNLAETRGLLYAEAELATGSVMGRLRGITLIRFVITLKGSPIATGVNRRGMGVTLSFESTLGGGEYEPQPAGPTTGDPKKRPGQPF